VEAGAVAGKDGDQRFDRVAEPVAALVVAGPFGQQREQVTEAFARDREEALVGGNPHDRLGDAERDDLRVGQHPSGVASRPWQEIVGDAEHGNQQQVEVGEHRGPLGSTARAGTADFDLTAVGPSKTAAAAVELLI
jgi:hypothetical protein